MISIYSFSFYIFFASDWRIDIWELVLQLILKISELLKKPGDSWTLYLLSSLEVCQDDAAPLSFQCLACSIAREIWTIFVLDNRSILAQVSDLFQTKSSAQISKLRASFVTSTEARNKNKFYADHEDVANTLQYLIRKRSNTRYFKFWNTVTWLMQATDLVTDKFNGIIFFCKF